MDSTYFDWAGFSEENFAFLFKIREGYCGFIQKDDIRFRFTVGLDAEGIQKLYAHDGREPFRSLDETVMEGIELSYIEAMGYKVFQTYITIRIKDYLLTSYREERMKMVTSSFRQIEGNFN